MTGRLVLRRLVIAGACLVVILGVAGVVRVAAVLRADAAPLVAAPVSADRIATDVRSEQARASDLSGALTTLESQTTGLHDALTAAGNQLTADAETATRLRSDLAAAKARLVTLQAQLAAAQARLARLDAAKAAAAPVAAAGPAGGGEHESGDDD